ncbi:MAG TPA: aminomethyl-transferring glycine dehydrogenase [Ignavibacteria bacterium]|nr:aminomethyl-transferring glycine dehydrogenase [Ignavibacteria bacterium]
MNNTPVFDSFKSRHIGPRNNDINEMLKAVNAESLDKLIDETVPDSIRTDKSLNTGSGMSEYEFLNKLRDITSKNKLYKNYIGLGYFPAVLPAVIQRNILENPGWYTQYTPYQAEISQGRLEALLNYQTVIADMTGLHVSNASLLDEGTAAAEAMLMTKSLRKGPKANANVIFVSEECYPQTIEVVKTRAVPVGVKVVTGDHRTFELTDDVFAVLVQYPSSEGQVYDYTEFFANAKSKGINTIVAADLMSLAMLKTPADMGADIAVGSTQRFGIPLGFGGPHAAYFATKEEYKRQIPGRIIGISIDVHNKRALRMALQTREQHIKREKATSNICTSQVLLAIMAGMYAVYHGPDGIKNIAARIHKYASALNELITSANYEQLNSNFFDTLKIKADEKIIKDVWKKADALKINLRYGREFIGISIDETTTANDIAVLASLFTDRVNIDSVESLIADEQLSGKYIPESMKRTTPFLTNKIFKRYHAEMEMMRYIKSLENKDLSLTGSMIPLGSCTMKLNAATEMLGITYPKIANIHPFAPADQSKGYAEMINDLGKDLCEITGFDGISFQPNSGAQGEYTGLMVIREYYVKRGDTQRNIILIPHSAHGTNPASAVMAGMKVVVVECDDHGNIDMEDLKKKAEDNKENLAGIMVTYPSTHGVFEESIVELCDIIHKNGGQVYMDGANMNAQVGLTSPGRIGADVCHLNLHKTFSIPHGGGGPGVGPIAVAKHLSEYLPAHPFVKTGGEHGISSVSSAPFGSAGVLVIPYAYIKMMGGEGLTEATKMAILNANYVKDKLQGYYKVLYTGKNGRVAHELIFDTREFKHSAKVDVIDIAKRLMDYGFHAPTVSFPVGGTLMFEPTESESKEELDRFCEAMIKIREEIDEVEKGIASDTDNVLHNAPHTCESICSDKWEHPYSREKAAFPVDSLRTGKFWPTVGRINDAYGDRNLVCSCPPVDDYL